MVPTAVGLGIYAQGYDLDADGLWHLGARTWSRTGSLYPGLAVHGGPGAFLFLLPFYALLGPSATAVVAARSCCAPPQGSPARMVATAPTRSAPRPTQDIRCGRHLSRKAHAA